MDIRYDTYIDFDWGYGAPLPNIDADTFAVRWTGFINPSRNSPNIHIIADDGFRLKINGVLVADRWGVGIRDEWFSSASLNLVAGNFYPVELEYFERDGLARIRLSMDDLSSDTLAYGYNNYNVPDGTGTGLIGSHYATLNFQSTSFDLVETTGQEVDFKWRNAAPLSGNPAIPADGFRVLWKGQFEPAFSEKYTFYTVADDGIKLWINGVLVIDNWTTQGATQRSFTTSSNLIAGQKYNIIVEYYDQSGDALAQLQWQSANQPRQVIPRDRLHGSYFGNGQSFVLSIIQGTQRAVPLTKQRLEQIAIQIGVVPNAIGITNQRRIGLYFESFVLGQYLIPRNGRNFPSNVRLSLSGIPSVRPDSVSSNVVISIRNGETTLDTYQDAFFLEVKATSCTSIGPNYRQNQLSGMINVLETSPIANAQLDGIPPIFFLATTSDPSISSGLINLANSANGGRGVSIYQSIAYEIQNTNPPLLFMGPPIKLGLADDSGVVVYPVPIMMSVRLDSQGQPPPDDDPYDAEQSEQGCLP
jgi:hypothetical protein